MPDDLVAFLYFVTASQDLSEFSVYSVENNVSAFKRADLKCARAALLHRYLRAN